MTTATRDVVGGPIAARRVGLIAVAIITVVLGVSAHTAAHPISTTAILLDLGTRSARATIELPLDELGVALDQQLTAESVIEPATLATIRGYIGAHLSVTDAQQRSWTSTVSGGHVANIDGVDQLVLDAVLAPDTGVMSAFDLHYDAIIDQVASHRVFVSAREGSTGDYTTLVMLSWQRTSVPVTASGPSTTGEFTAAVHLGIDHIRTGSDHLLFITMLLLPAPLIAAGARWRRNPSQRRAARRVVHVVTAFTVGHSLTLALGTFGVLQLPNRIVESGIALSVLLSAIHAIRPLARRGEVVIAGSFGLLHGLAFASVLQQLDLGRIALIKNLLGFNVGIELTQLCVVALVMPSLIVMSRTRLYPTFRVAVAGVGGLLAAGWLLARVGVIVTNPLEGIADLVVDHPFVLAIGTGTVAVVAASIPQLRLHTESAEPAAATAQRDPAQPTAHHHSLQVRAAP